MSKKNLKLCVVAAPTPTVIAAAYADRLIDEGGVSTDLFTAAIGAENTSRFFHEVFFGDECYRP